MKNSNLKLIFNDYMQHNYALINCIPGPGGPGTWRGPCGDRTRTYKKRCPAMPGRVAGTYKMWPGGAGACSRGVAGTYTLYRPLCHFATLSRPRGAGTVAGTYKKWCPALRGPYTTVPGMSHRQFVRPGPNPRYPRVPRGRGCN